MKSAIRKIDEDNFSLMLVLRRTSGGDNKDRGEEIANDLREYLLSKDLGVIPNSSCREGEDEVVLHVTWGGTTFIHLNFKNEEMAQKTIKILGEFAKNVGYTLEEEDGRLLLYHGS